jgi:hypothetical protein
MRRVVYAESRKLRLRVNGFKEGDYVEPGGVGEVPRGEGMPDVEAGVEVVGVKSFGVFY